MEKRSKARTVGLLSAVALLAMGCGARVGGPVDNPDSTNPTVTPVTSSASKWSMETETVESSTTTSTSTSTVAIPGPPEVDEIDTLLDGLDDTLAELDLLLNEAAAALAAEEGEIIP